MKRKCLEEKDTCKKHGALLCVEEGGKNGSKHGADTEQGCGNFNSFECSRSKNISIPQKYLYHLSIIFYSKSYIITLPKDRFSSSIYSCFMNMYELSVVK